MSRNFHRSMSITGPSGQVIAQSVKDGDLRIQFATESRTTQAPHQAQIVISNPSAATVAKIGKEFTSLTINAGYADNVGPIFTGQIIETQYGEKVDTFTTSLLRIWCTGWDDAYNQGKVSTSLAAGCTPQDIVDTCVKAMAPYGVTLGQVVGVDLSQPKFPRGVVLAGMARDFLREVALSANATHTINDGKLDIIGKNATLPSNGITISATTGMLGQPIQRQNGIIVRCLMNPAIRVNSSVTVKAKIISPSFYPGNDHAGSLNLAMLADYENQISPSQRYRVIHLTTNADTRGAEWEMELTLLGQEFGPNASQLNLDVAGLGYS